jgi:hypothetical protein
VLTPIGDNVHQAISDLSVPNITQNVGKGLEDIRAEAGRGWDSLVNGPLASSVSQAAQDVGNQATSAVQTTGDTAGKAISDLGKAVGADNVVSSIFGDGGKAASHQKDLDYDARQKAAWAALENSIPNVTNGSSAISGPVEVAVNGNSNIGADMSGFSLGAMPGGLNVGTTKADIEAWLNHLLGRD